MILTLAQEGLRMFARHLRVRGKHYTRVGTYAHEICSTTIDKLYVDNGLGYHYKASLGHYPVFYARDFGMMADSLLALGKEEQVEQTIRYAIENYQTFGQITTFISKSGKPTNFPLAYSPDSVAYVFYAIKKLVHYADSYKILVAEYRNFLQEQMYHFCEEVLDDQGMMYEHKHFGGMRDHAKRNASCYDFTMVAVMQQCAKEFDLDFKFKDIDYAQLLIDKYWTGEYFKEAIDDDAISGDACIYPFWLGVIQNTDMLNKTIAAMQKAKLTDPMPIHYREKKSTKKIFVNFFTPHWDDISTWPMSGLPFIQILAKVDRELAKKYLAMYTEKIEEYGTFVEVYKGDKPYSTLFYSACEGMIWSALYLDLEKELN